MRWMLGKGDEKTGKGQIVVSRVYHCSRMRLTASSFSRTHRHSTSRHRSGRSLADAELQRAIQLSLEEVGHAGGHARPGYVPTQPTHYSEPPLINRTTYPSAIEEEDDPDLKAAIEASLREANAPKPSAPMETPRSEDAPLTYGQQPSPPPRSSSLAKIPSYELEPLESDVILTFSQTVEQVHTQGGRDMSRYPAVGELYDKANGLRPKLVASLDDANRKERECLSSLPKRWLEYS